MDKIFIKLAVGLLSLILLTACSSKSSSDANNSEISVEVAGSNIDKDKILASAKDPIYFFQATILEINENSLTVKPDKRTDEAKGNETIIVNLDEDQEYDFEVDDIVKIEYDGKITKSTPAQISTQNITLVERAGDSE